MIVGRNSNKQTRQKIDLKTHENADAGFQQKDIIRRLLVEK